MRHEYEEIINVSGNNILKKRDLKELIKQCQDDEVILRVIYTSICGSDVGNMFDIGNKKERVMGHEYSGQVIYIGKNVPSHFKNSKSLYNVQPNIHCGNCEHCKKLKYSLCKNKKCYGGHLKGGYSEYTIVNFKNLVYYSELDAENSICSCLPEPVSCVIKALKKVKFKQNDKALIVGSGFTGLTMLFYLLKEYKIKNVESVDLKLKNREMSSFLGAKHVYSNIDDVSKKYDVVIDTTGLNHVVCKQLKLLKPAGKLLIFGVAKEKDTITLDLNEVWKKEIKIIGSRSTDHSHTEAIEFIKSHEETFVKLITHKLELSCLENISHLIKDQNYVKGVICRRKSL